MSNIDRYPHIKKYAERMRGADANKPLVLPADDARGLNTDITKLLLDLQSAQSQQVPAQSIESTVLSGGNFKSV